ncbi:hypothetical protein Y032_0094g2719 [Ancylostoma ceylanicum]|uniref:Uncharacterized protein n=1 Tax=Ancylostoma ceylanicum TaxID=53326 RepID=A0A016TKY7_9BILA|nr:hypothetical protein Y032_0094g2719 [Ancylostoma ceylanicum]
MRSRIETMTSAGYSASTNYVHPNSENWADRHANASPSGNIFDSTSRPTYHTAVDPSHGVFGMRASFSRQCIRLLMSLLLQAAGTPFTHRLI